MSLAEFIDEIRPAWMRRAACKGMTRTFFDTRNALPAKNVCAECPVVDPCLDFALADPGLQGVWGGTTEADRDRLRERNAS
jgi:WhiB family transcriptional regulator, redox-sensing transcriptional regulator